MESTAPIENRLDVLGAVQHAEDLHLVLSDPVEDQVLGEAGDRPKANAR